jgi:hypothetical protein
MTPLKLKAYLVLKKQASEREVARALAIDIALACQLLQFWVKRGFCVELTRCDSCQLCDQVYYQWVDPCIK